MTYCKDPSKYSMSTFAKTPQNTVNRRKQRGVYDYDTIHGILNAVPLLHVSFNTLDGGNPWPVVLPMLGFVGLFGDDGEEGGGMDLYLHGYVSSRLMRCEFSSSSLV